MIEENSMKMKYSLKDCFVALQSRCDDVISTKTLTRINTESVIETNTQLTDMEISNSSDTDLYNYHLSNSESEDDDEREVSIETAEIPATDECIDETEHEPSITLPSKSNPWSQPKCWLMVIIPIFVLLFTYFFPIPLEMFCNNNSTYFHLLSFDMPWSCGFMNIKIF